MTALHIDLNRQTSVYLILLFFCGLSEKFSKTSKMGIRQQVEGINDRKIHFPRTDLSQSDNVLIRAALRQHSITMCLPFIRVNTGNFVTSEEMRG
jgi:hypothetical protein